MKNLLTLLLLVMSLLAFGQSDSQSLEVEIKYWKSIAESNDTVAYREYLQRYGEDGLYKNEALTRIALLKTSEKQVQSKSIECHFYSHVNPKSKYLDFVVRFDAEQSKVWLKPINYDTVRSNLAVSRDYYEDQAAVAMSRDLYETTTKSPITGKITFDSEYLSNYRSFDGEYLYNYGSFYITATHTPSGKQYTGMFDGNGNYYLSIPPGGPYNIEYCNHYSPNRSSRKVVDETSIKGITITLDETKIINATVLYKRPVLVGEAKTIPRHKNAWTNDEEYQYDPMKSTSARDVYFKRDNLNTMQGYRYVAFSKDKSSFIMWFEQDNNLDGVIRGKTEYMRVPKEELLPKAVNYDFLNE